MVKFSFKSLGATLLLPFIVAACSDNERHACFRRLAYPRVFDMDEISARDESLTLDLKWMEINPGFGDQLGYENDISEIVCGVTPFMTRALGGSVPGPTLTVSPGTSMRIKFKNQLTYQVESKSSRVVIGENVFTTELDLSRLNKFNDPDIANLHFHGLHVPGALPGDDTTLEVLPQEEYDYVIDIPEDHEPGLHWVHPHHHGSSTLQLVGGAALALIVKDPEGSLPAEISEAPERVLVFQDWDINEAIQTARHADDKLILDSFSKIEGGDAIGQRFVTVNGQYQPITEITVGKWERWRILYAGWQDLPLNFGPTTEGNTAECEFHLLAKDGIYLSDYPRGPMLTEAGDSLPVPPGGRADFMVRCNKAGETTRFEALSRRNVLTVNCVEDISQSLLEEAVNPSGSATQTQRSFSSLTPWSKTSEDLPDYLQSVMGTPASKGCTCETKFSGYDDTSRVNNQIYRPGNNFMHTSYMGAVVERMLEGMDEHSYHQHVYPYQLIDFPNSDENRANGYFKIGDWHDTYLDKDQGNGHVTIRYKTVDFSGKIMVHCHNTLHADSGMIQKEYVRNVTLDSSDNCQCDIFGPIQGVGINVDLEKLNVIGAIDSGAGSGSSARPGIWLGFVAAGVIGTVLGAGF